MRYVALGLAPFPRPGARRGQSPRCVLRRARCIVISGMFVPAVLVVIAGLAVLAIRANRHDRHPAASAALWILVFVLLFWVALLSLE